MVKWYPIAAILGQGGFGITYLATDTHLQVPVAIKEYLAAGLVRRLPDLRLQPGASSDRDTYEWGLQRFIDEAKILARFDHPNILTSMEQVEYAAQLVRLSHEDLGVHD
jgi:serine/threonine protein kinase